jgi:hypothetical protein
MPTALAATLRGCSGEALAPDEGGDGQRVLMAAKKAELKATARTTELHFQIRKVNNMVLQYRY